MILLTGLWKNKTQDGQQYLSGTLGGGKVLIFQNTRKKSDNSPDYLVYVAEKKKKEDGGYEDAGQPQTQPVEPPPVAEDDLPF